MYVYMYIMYITKYYKYFLSDWPFISYTLYSHIP